MPSPWTSHAKPTRGAMLLYDWGCSERFGAAVPPVKPASWHQLVPSGCSMPLQGSLPSAALKSAVSNAMILSLAWYGFMKTEYRTPRSRVTFGRTFQVSLA